MLIRQALYAGLLVGAALLATVLATMIWRGPLAGSYPQFFPLVFAPLVVTGIVAVRRAAPWIGGTAGAALAGALAGLTTALLAMPIFYFAMFVQVHYMGFPQIPGSASPKSLRSRHSTSHPADSSST